MTSSAEYPEIYYFYDEDTRTVFWTTDYQEDRHDLIFLGSSVNPNKRMAVEVFIHKMKINWGHNIMELPTM